MEVLAYHGEVDGNDVVADRCDRPRGCEVIFLRHRDRISSVL